MIQSSFNSYHNLQAINDAQKLTKIKANTRVQLKMPDTILKLLKQEFPRLNRSELLTRLAIDALLHKKRIADPTLEHWVSDDQYDLDRLWAYLDERENH